jgi:hypothetical protein
MRVLRWDSVRCASRVAVALDLGARSWGRLGELRSVARGVVVSTRATGAGGHGRRGVVVEVVRRHRVAWRRWLKLWCVHVRYVGVEGVCGGSGESSRGRRAQAGACSPLNVQTVRVSSRARAAGGAERWMGSSGGGGKENPGLSAAHLVLRALGC